MGTFFRMTGLAVLVLAGLFRPASALDQAAAAKVLDNAVTGYIRPVFNELHLATAALADQTGALCANPSTEEYDRLKTRFAATVKAWSRAEIITIGPLLEGNRLERFSFYPDRKSLGLKQVEAILAEQDTSVLDPLQLASKSVGVQGLGAFEYVMFGAYPESVTGTKDSFRCRYGRAIADNVDRIATGMAEAWSDPDGISAKLVNPGPDNPVFRNESEAVTAILGFMVHGMEMWRERRVEMFWRGKDAKPRPRQAIFWRSANTFAALTANLEGMRDLWVAAGLETLLDDDVRSISGSILFDFKALIAASSALAQPDEARLADPAYTAKLDYLLMTSRDLLLRINDDYGKAIGLGAGFSFSDGD